MLPTGPLLVNALLLLALPPPAFAAPAVQVDRTDARLVFVATGRGPTAAAARQMAEQQAAKHVLSLLGVRFPMVAIADAVDVIASDWLKRLAQDTSKEPGGAWFAVVTYQVDDWGPRFDRYNEAAFLREGTVKLALPEGLWVLRTDDRFHGLLVGDRIVRIDGEPVPDRLSRVGPLSGRLTVVRQGALLEIAQRFVERPREPDVFDVIQIAPTCGPCCHGSPDCGPSWPDDR